jgi:voltage-gated potassium channel
MFRKRLCHIREKVYNTLRDDDINNLLSNIVDGILILLICLNIIAVILDSYKELQIRYYNILKPFEYISLVIFSIEYILRVWTSPLKYSNSRVPYLRFVFSFLGLIDLLAILPFYFPLFIKYDLRIFRIFRLFRIFNLLKLNRYTKSFQIIGRVLKKEKEKLVMTLFITGLMILFASSLLYYIENPIQPDKFPNIIETLWWAIATLTTADYGDVAAMTMLGKILSGIIAILGIGLVALPSGIICSGLVEDWSNEKKIKAKCPHCGKEL